MKRALANTDVTGLLQSVGLGDREASDELLRVLGQELRELARQKLKRMPSDHTLQPTALVNEVYLRLVKRETLAVKDRGDFLRFAARAMQDVLVERARRTSSLKRGAGWQRIDIAGVELADSVEPIEILALDEALEELGKNDPRKAEIVRLRFFVGLSEEEMADVLSVSVSTIRRDWRFTRAWLLNALRASSDEAAE